MSTPTASEPRYHAFAARLASARKRVGKSQETIATEVGTSRRNWIRWENGHNLPSPRYMGLIAKATGKSVGFLNGDEQKPQPEPSAADEDEESDLEAALRAMIRRLVREEVRDAA